MCLCTEGSERRQIFFFFFFLLHCNPDLTFKWKSQQIMTCPYLTEPGLKVFERQRGLYLNGKVAPETHNATGLWLSLEPESWTVHLIYSPSDFSTSERVAQVMVILWESSMKQKKTEKQQTQLPIPLYKRCKTSLLTIKLPFTVDCFSLFFFFFLYTCWDLAMMGAGENAQGK